MCEPKLSEGSKHRLIKVSRMDAFSDETLSVSSISARNRCQKTRHIFLNPDLYASSSTNVRLTFLAWAVQTNIRLRNWWKSKNKTTLTYFVLLLYTDLQIEIYKKKDR